MPEGIIMVYVVCLSFHLNSKSCLCIGNEDMILWLWLAWPDISPVPPHDG